MAVGRQRIVVRFNGGADAPCGADGERFLAEREAGGSGSQGWSGVPQPVAVKITSNKTDSMFRRHAVRTVEQQPEALRTARLYREQQPAAQREKSGNFPGTESRQLGIRTVFGH
jgi:hypothetical protein